MREDRIEQHLRRILRATGVAGGLGNPDAVAIVHGTLAAYSRSGRPVDPERLRSWATAEGWAPDDLLVLRGIALAAEHAMPDLGELTTTKADDGALLVHLTRDEACLAHAALVEIVLGPYSIPDREFHTLTGFRRDAAQLLQQALRTRSTTRRRAGAETLSSRKCGGSRQGRAGPAEPTPRARPPPRAHRGGRESRRTRWHRRQTWNATYAAVAAQATINTCNPFDSTRRPTAP
jgi:hypothetical protein